MRRLRVAAGPLIGEVVVDDLIDRVRMRERHKLVILCDILPVVHEHGLDVVWDRQLDGWPGVEAVLLGIC
jgi:hypothetical protein